PVGLPRAHRPVVVLVVLRLKAEGVVRTPAVQHRPGSHELSLLGARLDRGPGNRPGIGDPPLEPLDRRVVDDTPGAGDELDRVLAVSALADPRVLLASLLQVPAHAVLGGVGQAVAPLVARKRSNVRLMGRIAGLGAAETATFLGGEARVFVDVADRQATA